MTRLIGPTSSLNSLQRGVSHNGDSSYIHPLKDYEKSSIIGREIFAVNKTHCKHKLLIEKKADESVNEWTFEYFKNEFLCLSSVIATHQDNRINGDEHELGFLGDKKYYAQAIEKMYWIPITRPFDLIPSFVINLSDLTPRLKAEFREFCELNEEKEIALFLKEIAAKFFENINFAFAHESVLSHLKVAVEN